jgi:HAD superfamily hydrolase (TIGR01509 family)
MPALLLGSISTVADTSELQRRAFNQAFAAHGLKWHWDQDEYRAMLSKNGGQDRIAAYARLRVEDVDANAIHETKSRIFQAALATGGLEPRAGVLDAVKGAKDNGWKVGLVTTTSADNVSALLSGLSPQLSADDFDVIVDASQVDQPKPDKAAYVFALEKLGQAPGDCVAVEDNVGGVEAAVAAGVPVVAFPNENTAGGDFTAARSRVDHLDTTELLELA